MKEIIGTALGKIVVTHENGIINSLGFSSESESEELSPFATTVKAELNEYFAGERYSFDLPYEFTIGTAFQKKVWKALTEIPYGKTLSYGELAKKIGNPNAARAVGGGCHSNPICIIVPCHRVIGTDGSLTGFGGGIDKKILLLNIEKQNRK